MKASVGSAVVFELSCAGIEVTLVAGGDGAVERLTYREGDDEREFASEQISNALSPQGTRATVTIDDGAADRAIVTFTVILPVVDSPEEGPFDVTAGALRTTSRSLFVGVLPGPQQSYEGLTLTGTAAPSDYGADATGTCRDWVAISNLQPPGPPTLIVTGTCTFPTPGYTVELRPHAPQGINPRDYLLDKVVTPPDGVVAQVLTDVEVRYEERTDATYDTVTILPAGPTIEVVEAR